MTLTGARGHGRRRRLLSGRGRRCSRETLHRYFPEAKPGRLREVDTQGPGHGEGGPAAASCPRLPDQRLCRQAAPDAGLKGVMQLNKIPDQ